LAEIIKGGQHPAHDIQRKKKKWSVKKKQRKESMLKDWRTKPISRRETGQGRRVGQNEKEETQDWKGKRCKDGEVSEMASRIIV